MTVRSRPLRILRIVPSQLFELLARFLPNVALLSKRAVMLGEWIDQGSAEGLKIIHITSNYRQSANQCGGSDECIFKMVVRASVHELGPATEDGRIRREHAVALLDLVEPELDFFGLHRILFTGNFYPSLYFTDSHRGHVQ
jgi:hypothetical protein